MMRLFVDTNVIVDFLAKREPFYQDARNLMALARVGSVELWMSSSQVTDLVYILSNGGRVSEQNVARTAVRSLIKLVHVCAPGKEQVDNALSSDWSDFEDAFVHENARLVESDFIVTRDRKGFKHSHIPALSPSEVLEKVIGRIV
jgi:predicted nucleic-acid-binding protein